MNKITKMITTLIALVLMVSLTAPAVMPGAGSEEKRLQPALAEMVEKQPDEMVRVVVHKTEASKKAEGFVSRQGGEVIKELALINAFVAELPAAEVPGLSRLASVGWVSLDAAVYSAVAVSASTQTYSVKDEFTSKTYNGNDGTVSWVGDWQEMGESNDPTRGRIEVDGDKYCANDFCLKIEADEDDLDGYGITRKADLQGAERAVFSFEYYRDYDDEGSGKFYPMVSADGGASWTMLDSISMKENDRALVSAKYELTPFIGSQLEVGFSFAGDEYEGELFIDNIAISYGIEQNNYLKTLDVEQLHAAGITGEGISIAVIDSGIGNHVDFAGRLHLTPQYSARDDYGHGTHVAGIIGGDGSAALGAYKGIAPGAHFFTMGVSDANGMAYESDVVEAMQWVFENKDVYNLQVVNLSLNSTIEDSYHNSPIPAAAEILWFNGIVVVASVGNTGAGGTYNTARTSPANDPFIITVGASDEQGTMDAKDDTIPSYSAYGDTVDGHSRPDMIAPGSNIMSALSPDSNWDEEHPDRVGYDGQYIRLSGTSMSAPMVTGAVALLLQDEPGLTPDQVKYRLINTASDIGGYPYLDVYAAVNGVSTEAANQDLMPHIMLAKMALIAFWSSENGGENIDWDSVNWNAVNWDSVNWNAVNWNSVNWNAVNWNAVNWNAVNWNAVNWNSVNWNSVNWNSVNWNSVNWNSVNWNSVQMNGLFLD